MGSQLDFPISRLPVCRQSAPVLCFAKLAISSSDKLASFAAPVSDREKTEKRSGIVNGWPDKGKIGKNLIQGKSGNDTQHDRLCPA
ncbi:MAG: hypothetical protein IIA76_00455 [Proteobacteria bacterium]|nr:hypothetical protein [Pseudomonadota bacterium]